MDIETDTATIQLEVGLTSEQLGDEGACEAAAATGESVIDEIGW